MPTLRNTQVRSSDGMIDFGIGQPSLSLLPLEEIRLAIEHQARQGRREFLAYGADQGAGDFLEALGEFLSSRYRVPVPASQLMVTAGASQALDLICTRYTKPGDTIFVEEPTYFLALLTFRDHGLNVVGIPIDAHGLRMDALEHALAQHRPVLLYTVPTFQNPSATTLPADRRERLLALSQQHDFLVVADEVYHMLDFGENPPAPLAEASATGRVLSIGSFSKICAPGLRLGWIQAAPAVLHVLMGAGIVQSGGGLNPFASGVALSLFALGLHHDCLDRLRSAYAERARSLCDALREYVPHASFLEPRGGFFVWLRLPTGRLAADVLEQAKRSGVSGQAGTRFARNGACADFMRLSFAYYESDQLVDGVKRLANVLR